MQIRNLVAGCITVAVVVTGAVASHLIPWFHSSGFGFSDNQGRVWSVETRYLGNIRFYQADGTLESTFRNEPGDPDGMVKVKVSGQSFSFHGAGRHDFRDPQGNLIGYAIAGPLTEEELKEDARLAADRPPHDFEGAALWQRERDKKSGGSGTGSGPYSASGHDCALDVYWSIRGRGVVTMQYLDPPMRTDHATAEAPKPEAAAMLPPEWKFTAEEVAVPRLAITANGQTTYETGYGSYTVRNKDDKPIMTLTIAKP